MIVMLPIVTTEALKQPYDSDSHNALLYALNNTTIECHAAVVTDMAIYLVDGTINYKVVSEITIYTNKKWGRSNKALIFSGQAYFVDGMNTEARIAGVQREIAALSKARYELYIEEQKNKGTSLFPDYTILPFEKTPEFFRRGIVVNL